MHTIIKYGRIEMVRVNRSYMILLPFSIMDGCIVVVAKKISEVWKYELPA